MYNYIVGIISYRNTYRFLSGSLGGRDIGGVSLVEPVLLLSECIKTCCGASCVVLLLPSLSRSGGVPESCSSRSPSSLPTLSSSVLESPEIKCQQEWKSIHYHSANSMYPPVITQVRFPVS